MGQVPVEIGVEGLARTDELDPRSPAGGEVYDVSVDGVIAGQIRKREVELYDGSARGQPIADQARRLSRINTNSPRPPGWIRGLEHVRDGGALNDLSTAFLIFDYASTAALPRVLPARLSLWEATLSRPVRKEGSFRSPQFAALWPVAALSGRRATWGRLSTYSSRKIRVGIAAQMRTTPSLCPDR